MIPCPKCGGDTNVTDTRATGGGRIRRRRLCSLCRLRFTTIEFIWHGARGPTPEMVPVSKRKLASALSELLFALNGDNHAAKAIEESEVVDEHF